MVAELAAWLDALTADWLVASLVAESAGSMVVMLGENMVACSAVM